VPNFQDNPFNLPPLLPSSRHLQHMAISLSSNDAGQDD